MLMRKKVLDIRIAQCLITRDQYHPGQRTAVSETTRMTNFNPPRIEGVTHEYQWREL